MEKNMKFLPAQNKLPVQNISDKTFSFMKV